MMMASELATIKTGILGWKLSFLLLWGVVLPLITISVELVHRLCANALFDPLPSIWHIGLVALVPIANCALFVALTSTQPSGLRVLLKLSSASIAISFFYSVLFIPVTPIAALLLIFFGFGFLPLTPLISLIAGIALRARLVAHVKQIGGKTSFWPGFLMGLCLLVGIDLPTTTTRLGLQLSTSESSAIQNEAIRWLRIAGNEKIMLQHCYTQSGISTDLIGTLFIWSDPIAPESAQSAYYRVTGKAYNSVAVPEMPQTGNTGWRSRARSFDINQGGTTVGDKQDKLSLSASRMDSSLDAQAALGYLEWTMVFKNDAPILREARAQIALPPEAVISRLTLWIDGEEREAAFAGTKAVRSAYEKVVRQQRDPVLVTSAGKDRALVQLYPVPANGEMKIRIGMTIPSRMDGSGTSAMQLPYFHEQNFSVKPDLRHAVWVDSTAAMQSGATISSPVKGGHTLRSQLEDARLAMGDVHISSMLKAHPSAWALDSKDPKQTIIQRLTAQTIKAPQQILMVVDASAAMRPAIANLADMAKQLPPDLSVTLIFAQDGIAASDIKTENVLPALLAKRLLAFDYQGGHNNLPALLRAQELALLQTDSAVLWLHGPQPVNFGSVEPLLQAHQRQSMAPAWYTHQVAPGRNRIIESANSALTSVTLHAHDLAQLFQSWHAGSKTYLRQFEKVATKDAGAELPTHKTSDHLVRLWAFEEVQRLMHDTNKRNQAVAIAQHYQLVTPVSGAVVLETKQQYDDAGLEPVKNGTVPTIPEPETWALISVALSVLAYRARRNKQSPSHAPA
jgi:Vault protein inter-alpha-trypsin domain